MLKLKLYKDLIEVVEKEPTNPLKFYFLLEEAGNYFNPEKDYATYVTEMRDLKINGNPLSLMLYMMDNFPECEPEVPRLFTGQVMMLADYLLTVENKDLDPRDPVFEPIDNFLSALHVRNPHPQLLHQNKMMREVIKVCKGNPDDIVARIG